MSRRGEIVTSTRLWPICRAHNEIPSRLWRGWAYCKRHGGWHPVDGAS